MTDFLTTLIEALREELKHYGEMLALLDHQRDLVFHRASAELLRSVADINAQSECIAKARGHRERCQLTLAQAAGLALNGSLEEIIPLLPRDYQPLTQALLEENNALLVRIQQGARQNHLLLRRSLDLMQRFISAMLPASRTTRYNEAGTVFTSSWPSPPLYEAIG